MSHHPLRPHLLTAALLTALIPVAHAGEFVYQGQLDDGGVPANGRYDLRIAAFGDEKSPQTLLAPIEFPGVEVKDGRFELRFDAPLAGDREAWLEVAVRDAGASAWAGIPGRSKALAAPLIGACWSVTGDAGSNPATNFLGTTDAQPLVLKTHNARHLRLEPSSQLSAGVPITANVIAGSSSNNVYSNVRGATISGGGILNLDPDFPTAQGNQASDAYGSVGGGAGNVAGNSAGTPIDAGFATVGGGANNEAKGEYSTISGGRINAAAGSYSMIPGGSGNCAGAEYSFAAGRQAAVRPPAAIAFGGCGSIPTIAGGDVGTFVWADATGSDFISSGSNQFLARADGGVMFNTSSLPNPGADDFVIRTRPFSGDADADLRLVTRDSNRQVSIYVSDANGSTTLNLVNLAASANRLNVAGGTGGTATLSHGGAWTNASSRTFKEGFAAIDPADVLERVLALGISRWSYIGSGEGEHVGPMAEDFHAAFGLGHSEKQIATVDADGVALAAIQGLNAKLEAENAALREEMAALRALVESRLHGEH